MAKDSGRAQSGAKKPRSHTKPKSPKAENAPTASKKAREGRKPNAAQGSARSRTKPQAAASADVTRDAAHKTETRGRGRPSTYNLDEAKRICGWIASGKPLIDYCKQPYSPHIDTVYEWRAVHPEFSEMYTRAREDQADYLADQLLQIADDSTLDHNDRRIKIDTRKWIASKLKARTYGDKVQTEVSGTLSHEHYILEIARAREAEKAGA
jgi:hypothetical protein